MDPQTDRPGDQTAEHVDGCEWSETGNNLSSMLVSLATIRERIWVAVGRRVSVCSAQSLLTPLPPSPVWPPMARAFQFVDIHEHCWQIIAGQCQTYKALHTGQPYYLADLIDIHESYRCLRSTNCHLLAVPSCVKSSFPSQAFCVSSPNNWNSLPLHIRSSDSLVTFHSRLKSHLFSSTYHV